MAATPESIVRSSPFPPPVTPTPGKPLGTTSLFSSPGPSSKKDGRNKTQQLLDDFLALKAKCADFELAIAQRDLRIEELASRAQPAMSPARGGVGTEAGISYRAETRALHEELSACRLALTRTEATNKELSEAVAALQLNAAREVQKSQDDSERHAIFLRSQLLEAKETNMALEQEILTISSRYNALKDQGMEDAVTEKVLVASDGVLHRLTIDHPFASFKAKYNVLAQIRGRTIELTGRRIDVQLLKAELLSALNTLYTAMVDPLQVSSAAEAREAAVTRELANLRSMVDTQEGTIATLHAALRTAQGQVATAQKDCDAASREKAITNEKLATAAESWARKENRLHTRIASLEQSLADAEATSKLALDSVKAEADVSTDYRARVDALRQALSLAEEAKTVADCCTFAAEEKCKTLETQIARQGDRIRDLEREARQVLTNPDTNNATARKLNALQEELQEARVQAATESGRHHEREAALLREIDVIKASVATITMERDTAKRDVASCRAVIDEMSDSAKTQKNSAASAPSDQIRLQRVEAENDRLRTELHRAFADMKTMSSALHEMKQTQDHSHSATQRVEQDLSRAVQERHELESTLLNERMQRRTEKSDLMMKLHLATEELEHQKRRVDLAHKEFSQQLKHSRTPPSSRQTTAAAAASSPSSMLEGLLSLPSPVAAAAPSHSPAPVPTPQFGAHTP